jgi:predicted metal-dependent hydrolase
LATGDRVKRPAIIQWLFPELAQQEPAAPKLPKQLPPAKPKPGRKTATRRKMESSPEVLFHETLDGIGPILYVRSKKARQLRVTLRPGKPVSVTVPRGESVAHARQFLRSKKAWIGRHLAMFRQFAAQASRHKGPVETLEQSCRRIVGRLGELSAQHGLPYSGVTFRHQKTRWGSCNRNNRLSLNLGLALLPPELLDYVLLHELLHTRIKNHSKPFWAELVRLMPDARARAVELRNHRPS